MNRQPLARILAIDVRRTRFGYVLFEGPNRLLDWGASSVSPKLQGRAALETARKRIVPLLGRCHPMVIVIKRPRRTKTGKSSTQGPILRTIIQEAVILKLSVSFVRLKEIFELFRGFHCRNKDDISEILAERFPELMARLPRRRGKWGVERPGMVIFDAVAAGVTYWQRDDLQTPSRNSEESLRNLSAGPSPVGLDLRPSAK